MADLRENKVKQRLAEGKVVAVPMGPMSPELVEHFGPLGFDGLWFEGEHGPVDFDKVSDLPRACDLWGMTSIVRVYQNEPATIYRTLDLGALGICVPHINSKLEAKNVVNATKFAPIGMRGSFTSRQGIGVEHMRHNEDMARNCWSEHQSKVICENRDCACLLYTSPSPRD